MYNKVQVPPPQLPRFQLLTYSEDEEHPDPALGLDPRLVESYSKYVPALY